MQPEREVTFCRLEWHILQFPHAFAFISLKYLFYFLLWFSARFFVHVFLYLSLLWTSIISVHASFYVGLFLTIRASNRPNGVRSSVVVKALRYWSDGPGIDSRWCHWEFFPWFRPTKPCALGSTQPLKMSTRDFFWGKGGRCVWLTTYHPCSAETSR